MLRCSPGFLWRIFLALWERKRQTEKVRETLGCVWHKVHKHNSKHNSPKRPSFFSFHILDAGYSFVNKSKSNSLHITYQGINCRTCNVNVIKVTPKERHSWAISFLLLRYNILTFFILLSSWLRCRLSNERSFYGWILEMCSCNKAFEKGMIPERKRKNAQKTITFV